MEITEPIVDLFAGAGGWAEGLRLLQLESSEVGVEWDRDAAATRVAAGYRTVRADVRQVRHAGTHMRGLIASPPCQTFSAAGRGKGREALDEVLAGIPRVRRGERVRIGDDERTSLVLEPLRWALTYLPTSIALEQVPTVQPVWDAFAEVLEEEGYSVETGVLSAEAYGVPQTRKRAILVARLDVPATLPDPTHRAWRDVARTRRGKASLTADLPDPITGAEALGWTREETIRRTRGEGKYVPKMADGLAVDSWLFDRPAVTVAASDCRLAPPSYRGPGRSQFTGSGVVPLTEEEAAIIQTFPPEYPWQGNKTSVRRQIGNAVPPRLAEHVLRAALL